MYKKPVTYKLILMTDADVDGAHQNPYSDLDLSLYASTPRWLRLYC